MKGLVSLYKVCNCNFVFVCLPSAVLLRPAPPSGELKKLPRPNCRLLAYYRGFLKYVRISYNSGLGVAVSNRLPHPLEGKSTTLSKIDFMSLSVEKFSISKLESITLF